MNLRVGLSCLVVIALLPNCIFRKSSRKYDCARATYENVLYKYEHQLQIFDCINQAAKREDQLRCGQDLRDEILLRHEEYNDEQNSRSWFSKDDEHVNYPFTQYKSQIDCDIERLEQAQERLYWKQEGLGKSVQNLINRLDSLRRWVVLNPIYSQERQLLERRRLLKLSNSKANNSKVAPKISKQKAGK